jgi:hypothetical protein
MVCGREGEKGVLDTSELVDRGSCGTPPGLKTFVRLASVTQASCHLTLDVWRPRSRSAVRVGTPPSSGTQRDRDAGAVACLACNRRRHRGLRQTVRNSVHPEPSGDANADANWQSHPVGSCRSVAYSGDGSRRCQSGSVCFLEIRYTASSGIEGSNPSRSAFPIQHKRFRVRLRPQPGGTCRAIFSSSCSTTRNGTIRRAPRSLAVRSTSPPATLAVRRLFSTIADTRRRWSDHERADLHHRHRWWDRRIHRRRRHG